MFLIILIAFLYGCATVISKMIWAPGTALLSTMW